jgi:hypothetical protein
MKNNNKNCPFCDSDEFISEPNKYDIFNFLNGSFEIIKVEQIESFKIFCRECGKEIDLKKSEENRKIFFCE